MNLSNDYIRGLVDGEGCFTFHTSTPIKNSGFTKSKIPAFAISMHVRDKELIEAVRDHLGVKNKVYVHKSSQAGSLSRGDKATLVIREIGRLKNVVVPFFYKKLKGYKAKQFNEWLEIIGMNPQVPESYKIIYRLHKNGYYERNERFV